MRKKERRIWKKPNYYRTVPLSGSFFGRDDHSFWYQPAGSGRKKDLEKESIEAKVFEDLDVTDPDELRILPKVELTDEWKKIADIIKVDLETESVNKGVHAGSLAWQIQIAGRDMVDYRKFLRKFAHYRETLGSNPEEFDYIYYTYGLELYHDMPLIEPLEYREDRRIQEFAIAIDTSGSVSQSRIQRFLESTVSILKSQETFDHKMKIYLIQCDAQIQHVTVIESVRQLQEYRKELTVYGYGGTDFRPVFFLSCTIAGRRADTSSGRIIIFYRWSGNLSDTSGSL